MLSPASMSDKFVHTVSRDKFRIPSSKGAHLLTVHAVILCIISSAIALFIGTRIGEHVRTQRIDAKIAEFNEIKEEVFEVNNRMISNISAAYAAATETEGQFNDLDDLFLNLWMDLENDKNKD